MKNETTTTRREFIQKAATLTAIGFDPAKEWIAGNSEAAKRAVPKYRAP